MGWVYGHKRRGAYIALAALLLQIAVSFGHVDLDGIVGADHLTLTGLHKTVLAKSSKQGPAQTPGDDDGYCPICASIFMVSTSFVSEPPQLPVPDGFQLGQTFRQHRARDLNPAPGRFPLARSAGSVNHRSVPSFGIAARFPRRQWP